MRRIFDDAQNTEAVARRQPFLRRRPGLDRQAGLDERFQLAPSQAESESDLAARNRLSELAQIAAQKEILLY